MNNEKSARSKILNGRKFKKHPKRAYVSYPIPLKDLPNQSDNVQRF
nr:MAG TPA: hypothetical protein [Caudoviricetes sp.]